MNWFATDLRARTMRKHWAFRWLLATVCAVFLTSAPSIHAQSINEIAGRQDTRTLRERAFYVMQSGKQDSLAIALYEQWLNAVPTDTSAAIDLISLYRRTKDTSKIDTLQKMVARHRRSPDPRERTMHTLQVRLGTYHVLMPAVVRPAQTYPAVVVLHGNGNSPEAMMHWARKLALDSVIFLFPQAPYPKLEEVMATHRPKFSASGKDLGFADSVQPDLVAASSAWYHDVFLDASTMLPISRDKPILIGFSQGGFHAYTVATRYPSVFKTVITICASMYAYGDVAKYLPELRTNGVDVLVTHGTSDTVVPLQTGELISAMLETAGVEHVFVPFNGGHWPTPEVTVTIRDWIRLHLP